MQMAGLSKQNVVAGPCHHWSGVRLPSARCRFVMTPSKPCRTEVDLSKSTTEKWGEIRCKGARKEVPSP